MTMVLVIPIFIRHRGCPHQCLFCNQASIVGTGQPGDQAAEIGQTIETWLARSPGAAQVQVAFYGGSFTCLPMQEQEQLLAQVQPYLDDGRVRSLRLSTRPDCITAKTVERLRASGVRLVELGVQSLDDSVLRRNLRGHSGKESLRAIEIVKAAGLQVGVQLLPGLPGETTRSFLAGVRRVAAYGPDLVRLYPALVVANSGLERLYRQGGYRPLSLNQAVALTCMAKEIFDAAGISVVRMGLQPSEALERTLVAGPYHPAFGELVVSRGWFKQIRRKLATMEADTTVRIHISARDHSAVVGMHKNNIKRLAALGYADRFSLVAEQHRTRGSIEYVVS